MQRQASRHRPQTHRLQVEIARRSCGRPCPPPSGTVCGACWKNDPRPSYQHDPERVYGMEFGGLEVHFKVDGEVLTVTGIDRR